MKAYTKDVIQTIIKGKKRFVALMVIAALGVCMMSGLKAACDDLRYTADKFFDEQNLFDIMVVSTMGLTDTDVEVLSRIAGIEDVEGAYSETVFTQVDGQTKQAVVNVLSQKDINIPYFLEGDMPLRNDEILVTQKYLAETGKKIGDTIIIEEKIEEDDEEEDDDVSEDLNTVDASSDRDGVSEDVDTVAEDEDSRFALDLEKEYTEKEREERDDDYDVEVEEEEEEPNFLVTTYTIVGCVIDATDINSTEGAVAFRSQSSTDYTFFVLPGAVSSEIYTAVYITLDNTDTLACYSDEYEARVDEIVTVIEEEIKVDREQARYEEVTAEASEKVDEAEDKMNEKFADAEAEILDAKYDIEDGWSELLDGKDELADGEYDIAEAERKLHSAERELNKAERELDDAEKQLDDAWAELEAGEAAVEEGEQGIKDGREQLDDAKEELPTDEEIEETFSSTRAILNAELIDVRRNISQTNAQIVIKTNDVNTIQAEKDAKLAAGEEWTELDEARLVAAQGQLQTEQDNLNIYLEQESTYQRALDESYQQEADAKAERDQAAIEIENGYKELDEAEAELAQAKVDLANGRVELEKAQKEFDDGKKKVEDGWKELEEGWDELEEAYEELADGKKDLEEGQAEFADGKKEYEDSVSEYEEKRAEALEKIADARKEIEDLKMTEWYVSTRTALSGYSNIKTDAQCIESIGNAFPILFMVVAILISLTTVSRMVEEDRGLIGTYKALGFTDREIRRKYVVYALLAGICGGILGDFLGFVVLPEIIFTVFGVMYQLPSYNIYFDWWYGLGGILFFIVGIVGAAIVSCSSALAITPAMLMRPKAPKNGSRVLLERVTPVWSRLSFLNKVTARNLFRYKKRLFMTLFGIAGCTSILLAGFTIKDTVTELMPLQYEKTMQFDLMLVADDNELLLEYLDTTDVRAYINPMISSIKVISEDGREESVSLIVVPNDASLRGYMYLEDEDGNKVNLEDGMVLSTINVSEVLGYEEGDNVTIQNMDLENADVEITKIVMNYLGNYIYMTENTYVDYYDEFEANGAFVMLNNNVKDHEAYAEELALKDGILSAISTVGFQSNFDSVFRIINLVVTIVITLAAALAFVVLFTLSTTNISERERELATIKVLGFFDREVHAYVNKETIILTTLGMLLGMPLGKGFGIWLMSILKMPAIYFADNLFPISYLYAAVITIIFAFIVNKITDKSLDKINPVEALKSIE